jgi:hypothetical protein
MIYFGKKTVTADIEVIGPVCFRTRQATGFAGLFDQDGLAALKSQMMGRRQSGGTGADNGNLLINAVD